MQSTCIDRLPLHSSFPVSLDPRPPSFMRRLLVLLIAIAVVWQGIESVRGATPGRSEVQSVATAAPTVASASQEGACGTCGETDGGECAGHLQHHAMAALDRPLSMGVGRLEAEHIVLGTGVMPSIDSNTPLRPPKAIRIEFV